MNRRLKCGVILWALLAWLPFRSPAPLVFTPGEGWSYETVGGEGKWQRTRAWDQLEVAQTAFTNQNYSVALKAAQRVIKVWPQSDPAPAAEFLVGRCYELKKQDEKAFKSYQHILEKYPKSTNVDEVLERQYQIATRFLGGQWFKLWTYIPLPPSMDRTAEMFDKIVKSGPYSDVATKAQMDIGTAREKQKHFQEAAKAYEVAADRYHDRPVIASEALYRAGVAYKKQAGTAEYDQSTAGQAIATFTDFMQIYPDDKRVDEAQKTVSLLKSEQARGNFEIAKFYEKRKRLRGARIYYNEVLLTDPSSPLAAQARERIDSLTKQIQAAEGAQK